ncbi:MAG TPA: zf-HC2 domain-containing protein [Chthonomonadaceae bacterium]|nr:zf-HC2 domain-containing protein [Chthonomonadaceae bacterium]
MQCEEVQGLLDLHLDNELTEEIQRKMERHLLRCPACAYEARTLEQTRQMLREAVSVEEPAPGFRERAAARLLDAAAVRRPEPMGMGRQWKLPLIVESE